MPNKKSWKVERVDLYAISNQDVPSGVGYDIVGLQASSAGFFYKDDAHLIAAAPEMLEALQMVANRCIEYEGGKRLALAGMDKDLCDRIESAIAKAEGNA